jgi:hypothetical protein
MSNVINAEHLFLSEGTKIHGFKNYGAYRDTVEYSNLLSEEVLNISLDILDYHGINVEDEKLIDDFTFINMFIEAAVDRSLGLKNEICDEMDLIIADMKKDENCDELEGT